MPGCIIPTSPRFAASNHIAAFTLATPLRPTSARTPPPRPTSPSTRFAPTLRHSATWASPLPFGPVRPSTPCLVPTSQRPHTHTARRLWRHRPAHAVRLATLTVVAAAFVRVASAGFARHRLPLPAAPRVRATADASARTSDTVLRMSAANSVSTLCTPRFTSSGHGAASDDADRRRVHLVRASVFNPLLASTYRQLLGSSPLATSPRSRRPPRCARRRRWLRITIVAGDAVHVHDPADHRGYVLPRAGDDDASQHLRDDDHGAAASPRRPLHIEAIHRAASRPRCLYSPPCAPARLAAFGDTALAHPLRIGDTRRRHDRSLVDLAGAAPPITGFRTSPSCTVHSTVGALCTSARAAASVLRTTAFTTSPTVRHSIAVAAPVRRVPRPRFPFAHTQGLSFLTACRGFGSHTRRSTLQFAERAVKTCD